MDKIILSLLQMEQQIRILHWQTKSYARHQAFGETYESLSGFIDKFVEVFMGKKGRFLVPEGTAIELFNLEDVKPLEFCEASCELLIAISTHLDPKCDGDLNNIKDEMLAEINKLKYLLTLQ